MKRFGLFSSIAAMCIALSAAPAMAQEGTMPDWANKNGVIGIGGGATVAGTTGLHFRTYVSPLFGIMVTVGLQVESLTTTDAENVDTDTSVFSFRAGLYGTYKLAYWQRGHLSVLFGVDIVTRSETVTRGDTEADASGVDVLIGLGLMGEWFPTQYLSLFVQAGLTIDFLGEDEVSENGEGFEDLGGSEPSGFALELDTQLLGAAGFTVWFN